MTRVLPRPSLALLAPLLLAAACTAQAEDRATLETTQIIGNRELPKVLYIVPWKKPGSPELPLTAPPSVVDEVLAPLDREVFARRMGYAAALAPTASPSAAPTAPTPTTRQP